MIRTILLSLALLTASNSQACPTCSERYEDGEVFDFRKSNRPQPQKVQTNENPEYESKLTKDCEIGIKAACEQLERLRRLKKSGGDGAN